MTFPAPSPPLGVVTLSSISTATGFGDELPAAALFAVISVEGNPVRYRDDGTAPTASVGVLLPETSASGAPWVYASPAGLKAIEFIPTTGSATVTAAFYGERGAD